MKCINFNTPIHESSFAFVGDYFCWTGSQKIQYLNLRTKSSGKIKAIKVDQFFKHVPAKWPKHWIAINSLPPEFLIESGWLRSVDKANVDRLANFLQVTIRDRAIIFNLNLPEPRPIDEVLMNESLMDPQKFSDLNFIPCSLY